MLPEKVRDHTTRPPGLTLRRPRSTWLPSARFGRHFLLLGRSKLPCGLRHRVAKGASEGPAGGGIPETEGRNMHLTNDVTGLIGRECPRLSPTTPLPPFPTPRPSHPLLLPPPPPSFHIPGSREAVTVSRSGRRCRPRVRHFEGHLLPSSCALGIRTDELR